MMTKDEAYRAVVQALRDADAAARNAEEAWDEMTRLSRIRDDARNRLDNARKVLDDLLLAEAGLDPLHSTAQVA